MAFGIGMGGQTTCSIVTESLFAAVWIEGKGEVLIGVVVVFGVLSQRIGNTRQLSFGGVREFGFVTRAVGNPVELMVFVQSGRITDDALAARYAPTLAEPASTVLVGIIAAAPYQRQDAFKGKVGFVCQKLQPVYRIDRPAGTYRTLTGQTGFRGSLLLNLPFIWNISPVRTI